MKAKIFLTATLMLALAVGSVNANPVSAEVNKTTINHVDGKASPAPYHHHRRHHHHHIIRH